MADRYAELRAALEAGPTPGPWTMDGTGTRALVRGADLTIVAVRHRLLGQAHEANARLIAAANPAVIRALLAERDAFADVLEAIASIKATPGRAKADALLASVVNLAHAALAQGEV